MPAEHVLRRVAIGCAIVLLFAPLGGRTMWIKGNTTSTDAAGYNVVAIFSGVFALAALAVALQARPRVVLPMLAAMAAVAAFALTVVVAGLDVWARLHGEVWTYGGGGMSNPGKGWTVISAWGPPYFTLAALIGAGSALALAASWLRQPDEKVVPRVPRA